jgi:uncharacterized protein
MGDISSEPTMEEILSSIKKIISEDGDKALSPQRPRRAAPRDPNFDELGAAVPPEMPRRDDDVLELTDMASEELAPPIQTMPEPQPFASQPPASARTASPIPPAAEIVSPVAAAASRSALDSLSALIVKPEVTGSDTLEGMVRELLRPMLKEWLDANLPDVVERVVSKEVARISGR